jgi:hypothetical protein
METHKKETDFILYMEIYFLIKEHFIYTHLQYKSYYISVNRNEYFTNKKKTYIIPSFLIPFLLFLYLFRNFDSFQSKSTSKGSLMLAALIK